VIILTQKISNIISTNTILTLSLTAEERTRTRRRSLSDDGKELYLQLPRGTLLQEEDILSTGNQEIQVRIVAKSEPVLTVRGKTQIDLMRAIYHLGNRHIPLEITSEYLRLARDTVLENLLKQMGLEVQYQNTPFFPENGAYHQH